jgi:hypothetical protein
VEENHFVFSQGNDSHSSVDAVKLKWKKKNYIN